MLFLPNVPDKRYNLNLDTPTPAVLDKRIKINLDEPRPAVLDYFVIKIYMHQHIVSTIPAHVD